MARLGIALQLYTVREELQRDFVGTIRQVAALGFEGVEFAGYGGLKAEELKQLLDELNLKAVGSHVSVDRIRDHLAEEIAYNRTIGTQYVVVPWLPAERFENISFLKETTALFNEAAKQFAEAGIQFGYHNHSFEFEREVDGQLLFDAIFANSSENVKVEMDTCWVQVGGQDPVAYIKKYAGRLPLIHLKDIRIENGSALTVELGQGQVDLKAVLKSSEEADVKWAIVEQDQCQRPALESVANSMQWVKQNYLAQ